MTRVARMAATGNDNSAEGAQRGMLLSRRYETKLTLNYHVISMI
jgi:hypothetical protein